MNCLNCASIPHQTPFDPIGKWSASDKYAYSEAWGLLLMQWATRAYAENDGELCLIDLVTCAEALDRAGSPKCRDLSYGDIAMHIRTVIEHH